MYNDKTDEMMRVNQFLISQIEVGKALGLNRKNAIFRAVQKTLDETGYDFSKDILLTHGDITGTLHLHEYDKIIMDGIKASIKAGRRPTISAICERKKRLKEITRDQFMNICDNLEANGKIRFDDESGKLAFFINEKGDM